MCHASLIWTTFGEKADLNQYFACDYELKNCFDLKGRKYFNNKKKAYSPRRSAPNLLSNLVIRM